MCGMKGIFFKGFLFLGRGLKFNFVEAIRELAFLRRVSIILLLYRFLVAIVLIGRIFSWRFWGDKGMIG